MSFYSAVITLILVMDPLGNIPLFLSILKKYSPREQRMIILRESFFAFLILTVFLFFGRYILKGLHISPEALSISGGVILFMIALRMIFPQPIYESSSESEPFVVPLAIPLTAGPSSLATVMLFASTGTNPMHIWFLAVLTASIIFTALVLCAPFLMRILGTRGLTALERLMGMILTTIAVQMFLTGLETYLH